MVQMSARAIPSPSADQPVETDRSGLEILDREECLRLLGTVTLGRVGVTIGALPVVVPINFKLVGDQVVFRVGVGTKLDTAIHNVVVAFEADDVKPVGGGGWSVSITGLAREVIDPHVINEMRQAHVARWMEWGADRFLAIPTDIVTGRRFAADRAAATGAA